MQLQSPVFQDQQPIPAMFTCEGESISPPLHWDDVPENTRSLALIMEDLDAPAGEAFTHWILYNIPPKMQGLDREVPEGGHYGDQARQGLNDLHRMGYGGPCPPQGHHRYVFRLYALDKVLELDEAPDKETLLQAMEGSILAQAELTGIYTKHERGDIALEHELNIGRMAEDAYDRSARYDEKEEEAEAE